MGFARVQVAKQFLDRAAERRVDDLRRDRRQRGEHESPLVKPWVGKGELERFDDLVTEEEQVEVDRSRRVADVSLAAEGSLDLVQESEQGKWIQRGGQLCGRVEEGFGAGRAIDGIGLDGRRDANDFHAVRRGQRGDRCRQ